MSKLIALDDGHGMQTAGKRSPAIAELGGRVIHENEFNRAVVNLLDIELKRCGFRTLLVAPSDADTPLATRTNTANNANADAYISIHYNAFDGAFNGYDPEGNSIHIYPNSASGRKLAECIGKYLQQGTTQKYRGILQNDFHVLRETKMVSILSENGFMDNKREALLMIDEAFQKEVAVEHCKGICDYFGVAYVGESTSQPATTSTPQTSSSTIYRVRKSWADVKSQIGAFGDLDNAKRACKSGYSVFDASGNCVYPVANVVAQPTPVVAPTPTPIVESAPDIIYKVYAGKWYSDITNYNDVNGNGYAGVENKPISGLMAKVSRGAIKYRVHTVNGKWYSWVSGYNVNDGNNGFGGVLGKNIDAIQMQLIGLDGYSIQYRVSNIGSTGYLPWVSDLQDYAGIFKRSIDKVQCRIVKK